MRKNSICLVNPTILIKRPVSELAFVLKQKGWDVAILTPRRLDKSGDSVSHHTSLLKGIPVYTYPTSNLPFTGFEWPIPRGDELDRLIDKLSKKYRVFQVWTHFYLSVRRIVSAFENKPNKVILTMDTLPAYTFRSGFVIDSVFKLYTRSLGRRLFERVNLIHVYGEPLKVWLDKWNISTPVRVIPTGILPERETKVSGIRKEFSIDNSAFVACFVGLINPRKGIDILIKLAKRNPDIVFLIVGGGPDLDKYKQLSSGLKNVILTGPRKDVFSVLSESDVFILPSRGEGLPGVVFEAMLCGKPVVASDIPCIDVQIADRKEGFLCPIADISCFSEALHRLKDDCLRARMGDAAKQKIESFYWNNLIDEYVELYECVE